MATLQPVLSTNPFSSSSVDEDNSAVIIDIGSSEEASVTKSQKMVTAPPRLTTDSPTTDETSDTESVLSDEEIAKLDAIVPGLGQFARELEKYLNLLATAIVQLQKDKAENQQRKADSIKTNEAAANNAVKTAKDENVEAIYQQEKANELKGILKLVIMILGTLVGGPIGVLVGVFMLSGLDEKLTNALVDAGCPKWLAEVVTIVIVTVLTAGIGLIMMSLNAAAMAITDKILEDQKDTPAADPNVNPVNPEDAETDRETKKKLNDAIAALAAIMEMLAAIKTSPAAFAGKLAELQAKLKSLIEDGQSLITMDPEDTGNLQTTDTVPGGEINQYLG